MLSYQTSRAMRHLAVGTRRLSTRAWSTWSGTVAPRSFRRPLLSTTTQRFLSMAPAEETAQVKTSVAADKESSSGPFVPTAERKYEFFQNVDITPQGVAVVRFDNLTKPVNTISFNLANEAKQLWAQEIENNDAVKAVVFSSAKPGMFIAGADIFDIQQIEDKSKLVDIIADGLAFFQQMRKKGVPLVAAIDGPALGGGLEWALWCDYRICTDNPKTKVRLSAPAPLILGVSIRFPANTHTF